MEVTLTGFEESMDRLEEILDRISDGETSLDESIELYAKAAELILLNNTRLNTAQVRIAEIDEKLEAVRPGEAEDEQADDL